MVRIDSVSRAAQWLVLVAATVAAIVVFALQVPAQAKDGKNAAVLGGLAAGVLGGAAVGALLNQRPAAAAPARRAVEEDDDEIITGTSQPPARYAPACQMMKKKVWIDDDTYTYKRIEVCE